MPKKSLPLTPTTELRLVVLGDLPLSAETQFRPEVQ